MPFTLQRQDGSANWEWFLEVNSFNLCQEQPCLLKMRDSLAEILLLSP